MKNISTILLATIPVGLLCLCIFALICVIMWIWNMSAYIVAARIAATIFVLLMVLVALNIREIVERIESRYSKKWWDLSNEKHK